MSTNGKNIQSAVVGSTPMPEVDCMFWRVDIGRLVGYAIRPAPAGTETVKAICLVFEQKGLSGYTASAIVIKDAKVVTADTMEKLKEIVTNAGLIWTDNYYVAPKRPSKSVAQTEINAREVAVFDDDGDEYVPF